MPGQNVIGLIRGAVISMPLGFALLVGGAAAVATGSTVIGAVLLVLAVLSVCVGCLLLLKVRNSAREASRRQQLSGSAPGGRHGDGGQPAIADVEQAAARPRGLAEHAVRQADPDQVSLRKRRGGRQAAATRPFRVHLPAAEPEAESFGVAAEHECLAGVAAERDNPA